MKRLQGKGLGSIKRQAEVLTREEEDKLWKAGLLGDKSPQQLLDTIIFYNGLCFALRSGREHRQLRQNPCQIQLIEKEGERTCLRYHEDTSKNRPGGLKGRKTKPKVVNHYGNPENSEKCLVRLFQKYVSLCPPGATAFYLQPKKKYNSHTWYTEKPLGHNTITQTIARLCTAAGIEGFKTNHSLRATAATRLYESGVDEQMVMEVTGHRSLEGVRSYKRTSAHQQQALSDIISNVPLDNSTEKTAANESTKIVTSGTQNLDKQLQQSSSSHPVQHIELSNRSENSTNIQTVSNISQNTIPGQVFNFNSCSSVTFNIHYSS